MSNSHKRERLSRTAARKAAKDADDLEAAALRAGVGVKVSLDESIYDQEISEEETDEYLNQGDPIEEVTEREVVAEQLVTAAVAVVENRQQIMEAMYPFRLSDTGLEYIGSRTFVYELCLAIGGVDVSEGPYKKLQIAFERLAGAAMSVILGPGTQFIRTGYPAHEDAEAAGEPRSFQETVAMLNQRMPDEWISDPNSKLEDPKDGGVDAVVWKRIDSRPGSLVYAANCGCGKNWLKERKHDQRPSEQLARLLSRPMSYHLSDFFCIPFHINERRDWDDACDRGRFVLDRVRLTLTAERAHEQWSTRGEAPEMMRELIAIADASFKPQERKEG